MVSLTALRQIDEVGGGDRHLVEEELNFDVSHRGFANGGRIAHLEGFK